MSGSTDIDINEIAEALNYKADLDLENSLPDEDFQEKLDLKADLGLGNTNPDIDFRKAVLNWMMPDSSRKIEANLKSVNSTYTCPSMGWMKITVASSINSGSQGVEIISNLNDVVYHSCAGTYNGDSSFFPVQEGEILTVTSKQANVTVMSSTFYPMKGVYDE